MKKFKSYLTELNVFAIVFLAAVLLLLLPFLFTVLLGSSALIGRESYYHYRIADEIVKEGIIEYDYLGYGGKPYFFNPYHYMLAGFFYVFSDKVTVRLLPFILGIFSIFLFYKVLQKFKLTLLHRFFTCLVFILSPAFIYTFSALNTASAAFFFALLGFYFLLQKKRIFFILSILTFVSTVFFGFANISAIIIFLFLYSVIEPLKALRKKAALMTLILTLASLVYYLSLYFKYGLPERITFIEKNLFSLLISDLGGNGLTPFAVLLAVAGIALTWKNKQKIWPIYIGVLFLVVTVYYTQNTIIYLNLAVSVFTAHAFIRLIDRKWELPLLKTLTIFILFLGLLFSTASYLERIPDMVPSSKVVESLEWLNENSEQGMVFSHYSRGFWIESLAKREVVMDEAFSYSPDPNLRFKDSQQIFQSRNLKNTKKLLAKYNIDYIWIDEEMKRGLVWTKEEQGLLFLFRNNETFNNIYNREGIEIWQVKNVS